MAKPKGIGYAHFMRPVPVRAAFELHEAAQAVLHILEPLDGPEKKAILRFKRAIERFEKVTK